MFETKMQHVLGGDPTSFWYGVVEDNVDPRQLGRLRVRIVGDHTQEKKAKPDIGIPTEELPWSVVINPVGSASTNGIGISPTGIQQGTWVVGYYLDGADKQLPVVWGTLIGIPEEKPDEKIGFHDPDEKFPMEEFLEEPDTNRLARGELDDIREPYTDCYDEKLPKSKVEKKGTEKEPEPFLYPMNKEDDTEHNILKIKRKKENLACNNLLPTLNKKPIEGDDKEIGFVWHEPITQYNAEYPYNIVTEHWFDEGKEHGHVEEWDSTPDHERYHRYHSSGTFLEIFNDPVREDCGTKVEKIVGENFEINLKNKHMLVKGDWRVTIEGNKDEYIIGNWNLKVDGCINWDVDAQNVPTPTEVVPQESMKCKEGQGEVIVGEIELGPPAVTMDLEGDWFKHVTGWTENISTVRDTTRAPLIEEYADEIYMEADTITLHANDTINLEADNEINLEAGNEINEKSLEINLTACDRLSLRGLEILEETCLLLQNIGDMEMIQVAPCFTCEDT